MQIFLNLTNNSIRALQQAPMAAKPEEPGRQLSIAARGNGAGVTVEVIDNGGGVAQPENLFRPFQPGAHSIGLGLYLSRAFARSFGGELRYKPLKGCACFIVELPAAEPAGADLPRSIEGETLHAEAS
jgi:signal transduction histidine kinase